MMKSSHFCLPLLLAAVGCAPKIFQFEATPSKVCKGQTATLHWNATHGGTITATPPNESPGTVFGQGSSVVTPQASGTYRFESKRLITSTEQEVRVEVLDPCTEPGPAVAAAPAP